MNRLGELERAIMEVLWEAPDPMTVRQVGTCLTDRDLAHTTVMTVLDRLAKKGFVKRQRAGRAWRYRPAESREAYVTELMLTALDQTGDRQAALTRFARSVSGAEAEALMAALEALDPRQLAGSSTLGAADGDLGGSAPRSSRSGGD
jgi:predicted transcriptional regulator